MDDLINLFVNEHGIYQYYFKIQVFIVFVFLLLFLKQDIIIVIGALYLSNMYIKGAFNKNTKLDKNKALYLKLQELQGVTNKHVKHKIKMSGYSGINISKDDKTQLFKNNELNALYTDATMIEFLHSIIQLNEYNSYEFYMLLKGTNNILKLYKEMDDYYNANKNLQTRKPQETISLRIVPLESIEPKYIENIGEMFETALELKRVSINSLHNMIYSVPKTTKMYKYIDQVLERYSVLVDRNLKKFEVLNNKYIKEKGITNRTKFISVNETKGYDQRLNHSIDVTKDSISYPEFYI